MLLGMRLSFIAVCSTWLLCVACGGQSRPAGASEGAGGAAEGDACKSGKAKYAGKRAELVKAAEKAGCQTDADCGVLQENNACVVGCGTPLPALGIEQLHGELESIAEAECGSCPPLPIPPCAPPGPLTCQQGACVN